MKITTAVLWIGLVSVFLTGCGGTSPESHRSDDALHGTKMEPEKGPHRGRLLTDGDFTLELTIFETGVPPEFRVWATKNGQAVNPEEVDLGIALTRLGDRIDKIRFVPQGDYLRGDTVIYEPHSFVVSIEAIHNGNTHRWQYDNFEGRTQISKEMAEAFGLQTLNAGPVELRETVTVYGRVVANPETSRNISARFEGLIQSVEASLGDTVRKGQPLIQIESNESLKSYTVTAPISGVITARNANPGEQTAGRLLFTITDISSVWVEFDVFPADRGRIKAGMPVVITDVNGEPVKGKITSVDVVAKANQAVMARVVLLNLDKLLTPGTLATGEITVATHAVPLGIKRSALQPFRDFTVVFAQIGDQYEVRMLDLGRQDRDWVEVLGGLDPGTRYVSENSYLVKADVEKSGASHDH